MTRLPANVSSTAWVTSLTAPEGPRGRSSPVNRVSTSTGRPADRRQRLCDDAPLLRVTDLLVVKATVGADGHAGRVGVDGLAVAQHPGETLVRPGNSLDGNRPLGGPAVDGREISSADRLDDHLTGV